MRKFIVIVFCLSLCACGGSGGSSTPQQTISGTASQGSPLTGTVSLKDAKGVESAATIGSEGTFTLVVNGMTAPYLLKAGSLYSFANGTGTVNINPFTDLAVKNAADTTDMATVYNGNVSLLAPKLQEIQSKIQTTVDDINSKLDTIYQKYGITSTAQKNFMNGSITIGQGMDAMFDTFKVVIATAGNISLKTYEGDKTIFTATINAVTGTMSIQWDANVTANLPSNLTLGTAKYKGQYKGTVDYNLAQYSKIGVPMQADVDADGNLTNVIIGGTSADASASTVLSSSGTDNYGTLQGSGSFSIQGVVVNITYTGKIDAVSGVVNIVYNVSGGLSGTMVVNGTRVNPIADTTGSETFIGADNKGAFGTVSLTGQKSTPSNSSLLTYEWNFVSKPTNSNSVIVNANQTNASFTPDILGNYVVELTVSISKYSFNKISLTIIADPSPVPDATINQTIFTGEAATLEVKNQDSTLRYYWSISKNGSSSIISTLTGAKPTFVPGSNGKYNVLLSIYNSSRQVASVTITVNVKAQYIDNGNGTVTDKYTHLTWPKTDYGTLYDWYDASGSGSNFSACKNLNLAGFSDWRLPTDIEARTLTRDPIFTFDDDSSYWTYSPASGYSLLIATELLYFADGYNVSFQLLPDKSKKHGVICVR